MYSYTFLQVQFDEWDISDDAMRVACETALDIGYTKSDDPGNGSFIFISCRCLVFPKKDNEADDEDDEEEAETTDEDFVPSDEDEEEDNEDDKLEAARQAEKFSNRAQRSRPAKRSRVG